MRPCAAVLALLIVQACVTSCSDHDEKKGKTSFTAAPGRFTTVIGTGPDGSPESDSGWFEDPIDLTPGPAGSVLALTKAYGRVFEIRPDGTKSQLLTLPKPGDALSIKAQQDGSILVAQTSDDARKLILWHSTGNGIATEISEQTAPKNPDSTHLVDAPGGKVLLLKDGQLQEQTPNGAFKPIRRPHGLQPDANILAASKDGNSLMVVLPTEFAWIADGRVVRRLQIAEMDARDGATITPDGSGGAFLARYGPAVDHYSSNGRDGAILLGYGAIAGCGNGTISGATGDASQQNIGKVTSVLRVGNQVYFADPQCHRVLSIGLPAKEYFS